MIEHIIFSQKNIFRVMLIVNLTKMLKKLFSRLLPLIAIFSILLALNYILGIFWKSDIR